METSAGSAPAETERYTCGLLRYPEGVDARGDRELLGYVARIVKSKLFVKFGSAFWNTSTKSSVEERMGRLFFFGGTLGLDVRVLVPSVTLGVCAGAPDLEVFIGSVEAEAREMNAARDCLFLSQMQFHSIPSTKLPTPLADLSIECEKNGAEYIDAFDSVCLGGTFDRLHSGHKVLLTMACLVAKKRVVVGITDYRESPKLGSKTLACFMENVHLRAAVCHQFMRSVRPDLIFEVVPITDAFGPSIVDKDLQAIVVSKETARGGQAVRKRRVELGLCDIGVVEIGLVGTAEDEATTREVSAKMSSSALRREELGRFLANPSNVMSERDSARRDENPQSAIHWARATHGVPYCVGITGGIACGKSTLAKYLSETYDTPIVDCDKLGHRAYVSGTTCFTDLVAIFLRKYEENIVGTDGEVDRRKLGSLVFSDPEKMSTLTSVVWPAIAGLAREEMLRLRESGHDVCIMEAAVLFEAQWEHLCDEIWVVVVPPSIAKERLMGRNKLSSEEADKRLNAQMDNRERVARADVVVCNQWTVEKTREQARMAWNGATSTRLGAANDATKLFVETSGTSENCSRSLLIERWARMCRSLGVRPREAFRWYRFLRRKYTERHRYYHTTEHLVNVMHCVDVLANTRELDSRDDVDLAVFFHDVVYDPRRKDNEKKSAQILRSFLAEACPSFPRAEIVAQWIERTATHYSGPTPTGDLAVFLDADLAILGSSRAAYARYCTQVRCEYAHYAWKDFAAGRSAILRGFCDRSSLFYTKTAVGMWGDRAKENVRGEILRLDRAACVARCAAIGAEKTRGMASSKVTTSTGASL